MTPVEVTEQRRVDLAPEFGGLVGDGVGRHRLAVDELQRIRTDVEAHVIAAQLGPPFHQALQPDMGERADDVGEHLDLGHGDIVVHADHPDQGPWPRDRARAPG